MTVVVVVAVVSSIVVSGGVVSGVVNMAVESSKVVVAIVVDVVDNEGTLLVTVDGAEVAVLGLVEASVAVSVVVVVAVETTVTASVVDASLAIEGLVVVEPCDMVFGVGSSVVVKIGVVAVCLVVDKISAKNWSMVIVWVVGAIVVVKCETSSSKEEEISVVSRLLDVIISWVEL